MNQSLGEYLRLAKQRLSTTSESAHIDAEILMSKVIDKDRIFMFAHPEYTLSEEQECAFAAYLERRLAGEPVAHIIEEKEFWSLPLKVNAHTLIPRPDTEILVEKVLEYLPEENLDILDLGTGTGAIALAIAQERKNCRVTAVDVVPEAVLLAKENANSLKLSNVNVLQSDWFSNVNGMFNCIVSNPPYIDRFDSHLTSGDLRFEPSTALVAEENGLADIALVAKQSTDFLVSGGTLFVEHGWEQGLKVRDIFLKNGYTDVTTIVDYGGNERVTFGCFNN